MCDRSGAHTERIRHRCRVRLLRTRRTDGCFVTTQLFTSPHSLVITRYYTDTYVQTTVSCDERIVDCVTFGDVLIGLPSFMIGVQPSNGAACSTYDTSHSLIGPLPNTATWTVCVTYAAGVVTCGDLTIEGF
jgi:hypothetical protein